MDITRHFTKVYDKPRKPLSVSFAEIFDAAENEVVSDVAFALTGKRPTTDSVSVQPTKKEK